MARYKGYSLPVDLPLLFSVFFLLPYYTLLLKLLPFHRVVKTVSESDRPARDQAALTAADYDIMDKIYRASGYFIRKIWRSEKPCLRRTLILHHWCNSRGIQSKVVIGVQKENNDLKSHAWLEIDGIPFRERADQLAKYSPILER